MFCLRSLKKPNEIFCGEDICLLDLQKYLLDQSWSLKIVWWATLKIVCWALSSKKSVSFVTKLFQSARSVLWEDGLRLITKMTLSEWRCWKKYSDLYNLLSLFNWFLTVREERKTLDPLIVHGLWYHGNRIGESKQKIDFTEIGYVSLRSVPYLYSIFCSQIQ